MYIITELVVWVPKGKKENHNMELYSLLAVSVIYPTFWHYRNAQFTTRFASKLIKTRCQEATSTSNELKN